MASAARPSGRLATPGASFWRGVATTCEPRSLASRLAPALDRFASLAMTALAHSRISAWRCYIGGRPVAAATRFGAEAISADAQ